MGRLNIQDHPEKNFITINGVNYDYSIFEGLGEGEYAFPIGKVFRFDGRKDGVIAVTPLPIIKEDHYRIL